MIFVTVSTGYFDALFRKCAELPEPFLGQIGIGSFEPPFAHFRFASPDQMLERMRQAEIVICHAGAGTLGMLYQLQKKCVVVPKQRRYGETNDGQVELAEKWASLGMGILCRDLEHLGGAIQECRQSSLTLPSFAPLGRRLRDYFRAELRARS